MRRLMLALGILVAATTVHAQLVFFDTPAIDPVAPTNGTRVMVRLQHGSCSDFSVVPLRKGFTIDLAHNAENCPILPIGGQVFVDLGYLEPGTYTVRLHPDPYEKPSLVETRTFVVAADSGASPCVPGETTACAIGRFKIEVRYRGAFDHAPVDTFARVLQAPLQQSESTETAFFYLDDPANIEVMVKVLQAAGEPKVAVLFGVSTPLPLEITVTDTRNNVVRTFTSPLGAMQGGADFGAFVK